MTNISKQNKRLPSASEVRCQTTFDRWLREQDPTAGIQWLFEPNGQTTSPDYRLTLDGQDYAVEMAIVMGGEEVDNQFVSDRGILERLYRLVKNIERRCQQHGVLSGAYHVRFQRAIQHYRQQEQRVRMLIEEYVVRTQHVGSAPEEILRLGDDEICTIGKIHDQSQFIGLVKLTGDSGAVSDERLCQVLHNEISDKASKMKVLIEPHILILDDQFHFASHDVWYDCLTSYEPSNSFHTIFVVRDTLCFAVFTQATIWQVLDLDTPFE